MYCPVCHSEYPADWKACPKDATSLLKSAQIGKYRIEGMLGVGGMGAVYKATNPDIKGSRVAIKVMNPAIAQAEQIRERFKREAAAVAALRTSHVVKVYDFNAEPDGTLYLVMELLDGHALRDEIMPAPSYMDLARVQMVMEGALKGLAAAHKVGIVHRDLKPENIFVAETDDGEVPKLLDFGIARVRTQDKNLTHTGSLMGTASYMATEQIAAGVGEIGPWSDVYAMGAILYEMLAGAPAFGGNTVTEVLQRVLKSEIVPLQSVRPGLPKEVYALVERCMSNQPTTRPQDAEQMRMALGAARMVPQGTMIPPPHKTRVDSVPPVHVGSSPGGTALGVMATEAHVTPVPRLTPPPATGDTPPTGVTPVASTTPIRPSSDVSAFGPTVGVTSTPPPTTEPVKKSKLPLIFGGVAVAGIGAFVAIKVAGGGDNTKPAAKVDAGVIATPTPDAAVAPADTAVVAAPDAPDDPLPPFTKEMVAFPAGEYDVGEETPSGAGSRKLAKVTVPAFFIDKDEITLDAVRKALTSPTLGGAPGDAGTLPARNVTWGQAVATCKALGKRLPTENEWEIAARTTPRDPAKAALKTASGKLVASAHTDCSADGLCDMLGGVIEWTADGGKGNAKIVRGASFTVSAAANWQATIFYRTSVPPTADLEVGFRCAWSKGAGAGPETLDAPKTGDLTPIAPKVPPQKPSQACEDVEAMYQEARRLVGGGNHAAAIAKAEAALACKPEPRGYVTIAIAACSTRNAAKATSVADKIQGPGQRMLVGQACADAGIALPGYDGVVKVRDRDRPRRGNRR